LCRILFLFDGDEKDLRDLSSISFLISLGIGSGG
jgi:hypothetical protein